MSNKIRDLIVTSLEVSKTSGVPVLFLSNPGLGKTTTINEWSKRNGYHVVSLIGSSFDRSEVMGYMVNTGKDFLEILKPHWFEEVLEYEAKGTPTVLFIDEISTAPADVQGSLYRLIFERVDGAGRKLPEDCMIVSAANYKGNLPPQFNLSAPALNRFCLVNLQPSSMDDFLSECLQPKASRLDNWLTFEKTTLKENAEDIVSNGLENLFMTYTSGSNSSLGKLNVKNSFFDEMYDAVDVPFGEVLNFTSFRTLDYLKKMILATASLSIQSESWISSMVDGLIGLGFNSFADSSQLRVWRKSAKDAVTKILEKLISGNDYAGKSLFTEDASLAEKVRVISLSSDVADASTQGLVKEEAKNVAKEFAETYPYDTAENLHSVLTKIFDDNLDEGHKALSIAHFKADMEALGEFQKIAPNYIKDRKVLASLKEIEKNYEYYLKTSSL